MHPKAALFCCYSFYRDFREQYKKKMDGIQLSKYNRIEK
jgi:hypothetical protein